MLRSLIHGLAVFVSAQRVSFAKPTDVGDACFSSYEGAQSSRRAGLLLRSKSELEQCISRCPPALASDCRHWHEELASAIPRLAVQVRGARGEAVASVSVLVDGQARSTADLEIDPGEHVIRVEAKNHIALERRIVAVTGARANEEFSLPELEPMRPPPAAAHAAPLGPYVVSGVGAAVLAAASVLSVAGWLDYDDLQSTCAPSAGGRGCSSDDISAVRTKWTAAGMVSGVGLLTLAGGILWWMFSRQPEPAKLGSWRGAW